MIVFCSSFAASKKYWLKLKYFFPLKLFFYFQKNMLTNSLLLYSINYNIFTGLSHLSNDYLTDNLMKITASLILPKKCFFLTLHFSFFFHPKCLKLSQILAHANFPFIAKNSWRRIIMRVIQPKTSFHLIETSSPIVNRTAWE